MEDYQYESRTPEFGEMPNTSAVFHRIDSLLSMYGTKNMPASENIRLPWTHHDQSFQVLLESNISLNETKTAIDQQDMSVSLILLQKDDPTKGKVMRLEFMIPEADLRREVSIRYNEVPFAHEVYDVHEQAVRWRSADGRPHKSELNEGNLAWFDISLALMADDLSKPKNNEPWQVRV